MVKSKALLKTVKALAGKHGATALTIFAALGVVATAVPAEEAREFDAVTTGRGSEVHTLFLTGMNGVDRASGDEIVTKGDKRVVHI